MKGIDAFRHSLTATAHQVTMSTDFFMGIRNSFADEAKDDAFSLCEAINAGLWSQRLPRYDDPGSVPDVYVDYNFGLSSLDHYSTRSLCEFAELAQEAGPAPHLTLILQCPRLAYLPHDFKSPIVTRYKETFSRGPLAIPVGSAPRLFAELKAVAPRFGIPLWGGRLDVVTATKINEMEQFQPDDPPEFVDELRGAWLVLYEGARLAIEHKIALSLVG